MATYDATAAKHATLTTTTVDTVRLSRWVTTLEIRNRAGGSTLWVAWRPGIVAPADVPDPTAAADELLVVPSSQSVFVDVQAGPVTLKLLGNGNDYSVLGS